jgi:hypothetical protein
MTTMMDQKEDAAERALDATLRRRSTDGPQGREVDASLGCGVDEEWTVMGNTK